MRGQEVRQARQHQVARHADRHVHSQPSPEHGALGLEQGAQVLHVVQQVAAALVEDLAVLRDAHAASGALQQPRAHHGLQLLHGARHAGLGQAQAVGRLREAAQLGHAGEDVHGVQGVHWGFPLFGNDEQIDWILVIYLLIVDQ